MDVNINDLPLPTNDQINEVAERVGSIQLDTTDVNVVRLVSYIIYQDKVLDQLSDEQKG